MCMGLILDWSPNFETEEFENANVYYSKQQKVSNNIN